MDADGVDVSILYPTIATNMYRISDSQLLTAMFRTYNDWIAEFCNAFPDRLKGIATLNLDDVQEGVDELERCAEIGLVGGMITVYPPIGRGYYLPEYEPLWAAAQDLGMPLSPPHRHQPSGPGPGVHHRNVPKAGLPGQHRSLGTDVPRRHDL